MRSFARQWGDTFSSVKLTIAALVLLFGTLVSTGASATLLFTVTDTALSPDSGYENPGGDQDLLYVEFDETFSDPEGESLSASESFSFVIGTVNFLDADGPGSSSQVECPGECDDLDVTATFTFTFPEEMGSVVTTTGTANDGSINDSKVDYELVWAPLTVDFGVGGEFTISINTLTFSDNDEGAKELMATVTLGTEPALAAPETVDIPEPGTLALFGIGLFGLVVMRRRKKFV